jgi:uncharacterized membrane protein YbhN (UPF0104 family)
MNTPLESATTQPFRLMRRALFSQVLLWLLMCFILVALFEWVLDWDETIQAWSSMPLSQIATSLALLVASYLARSARLYTYLSSGLPGQLIQCLRITLQHNFFINILPFRAGEAVFPVLAKRYFGIPVSQATGTLFSFRMADLLVLSFLGLIMILTGIQMADQASMAVRAFLFILLIICLVLVLLHRFGHSTPRLKKYWALFKSGLPDNPAAFIHLFIWTFLAWSTKLVAYASILMAFLQVSIPVSLLSALSGELASSIPIHTPAAFGTFESGVVAVLMPAGINIESALTAAINLHLFILSVTTVIAGLGLLIGRRANVTG